jgi:hypothetical protein
LKNDARLRIITKRKPDYSDIIAEVIRIEVPIQLLSIYKFIARETNNRSQKQKKNGVVPLRLH